VQDGVYETFGVSNGVSNVDDQDWFTGTVITQFLLDEFILPFLEVQKATGG